MKTTSIPQLTFTDRSEQLAAMRARRTPADQAFIDDLTARAEMEERTWRMSLAAVREAGHQTQAELARRLGKPRGNLSRTEKAPDMLWSTLREYLEAAGAQDVAITATVAGQRVEVELADAAQYTS